MDQYTGFNDSYHAGRNSKHASGLAGDLTIRDPSKSAEAAEDLRKRFRAAGLSDDAFRVLEEYRNPSRHATAGHLHFEFQNQTAADQYAAFMRSKSASALAASAGAGGATPQGLAASIPTPSSGAGGSTPSARSGGASTPPVTIHINGGNHDAEALATRVQQRIQEVINWQTHDTEVQYG